MNIYIFECLFQLYVVEGKRFIWNNISQNNVWIGKNELNHKLRSSVLIEWSRQCRILIPRCGNLFKALNSD